MIPVHSRTILVTGAAGFVGSHLAEALLDRGDTVVVVDEVNDYYDVRIKEGNLKLLKDAYGDQVTIYRGDICDKVFLDVVFANHTFNAIAHMAARAGVRPSIVDPFIYVHSNIKGTIHLLDRAVKHNISNFVYASSSSVYGGSKSTYFSELEQVDRPISPYAATKKSCELFAYAYHRKYGLHTTGLRFFTVYGPRGRPDMAVWYVPFNLHYFTHTFILTAAFSTTIRKFIDRISSGKIMQQYGNGTSSRDYTYVADIVNGIVRALDRPNGNRVINLGKGSGTKLKDLVEMIENKLGKKANIEILPDQPGDVPYTCANVSIAYHELGYNASFPTAAGVGKTVEWFRETYPSGTASTARRRKLQSSAADTAIMFDDTDGLHDKPIERRRLQIIERNEEKKTILVTGGTIFVGSHVVEALLDRGDRVVLVDCLNSTEQSKHNLNHLVQQYGDSGRVIVYLGNMNDRAFLRDVFERERPKWIFHLAGETEDRMTFEDSIGIVERSIDPTLQLLELSKGKSYGGFDVENFVILGSAKVYGRDLNHETATFLQEEDRVDAPMSPFAASKKGEELLAFTYHHLYDIPVSILRVASIYGPRHDFASQSFDLFHKFLQNLTSEASDDSSWVYVGDVTSALLSSIDRPIGYEIINVGGRNCPESLETVFQMMDKNLLGIASSNGNPQACLSMEKARQSLSFRSSFTLLEGVMETIKWHRSLFDYSQTSIRFQNSKLHQPLIQFPNSGRGGRGWGIMRNFAYIQWTIVLMVVAFRFSKARSTRDRSPRPSF